MDRARNSSTLFAHHQKYRASRRTNCRAYSRHRDQTSFASVISNWPSRDEKLETRGLRRRFSVYIPRHTRQVTRRSRSGTKLRSRSNVARLSTRVRANFAKRTGKYSTKSEHLEQIVDSSRWRRTLPRRSCLPSAYSAASPPLCIARLEFAQGHRHGNGITLARNTESSPDTSRTHENSNDRHRSVSTALFPDRDRRAALIASTMLSFAISELFSRELNEG